MSLPLSVKRCAGRNPGEPVPQECFNCFRRSQGVADYIAGEPGVEWMEAPKETPCPERLAHKREARNA
jgi:hypothetical protein